jgi:hypothetical protein
MLYISQVKEQSGMMCEVEINIKHGLIGKIQDYEVIIGLIMKTEVIIYMIECGYLIQIILIRMMVLIIEMSFMFAVLRMMSKQIIQQIIVILSEFIMFEMIL